MNINVNFTDYPYLLEAVRKDGVENFRTPESVVLYLLNEHYKTSIDLFKKGTIVLPYRANAELLSVGKITAIKILRSALGYGLKEAKDIIDACSNGSDVIIKGDTNRNYFSRVDEIFKGTSESMQGKMWSLSVAFVPDNEVI